VGGLINTISKRPTEDWTGEVRGVLQNFGYTKIEGTISGPIKAIDGLSFRRQLLRPRTEAGLFQEPRRSLGRRPSATTPISTCNCSIRATRTTSGSTCTA